VPTDNVDYSQRTADGPGDDDASREVEQTINILREVVPYWWRLHDPEELAKLKEELREGEKPGPPKERPKSQLQRDNEFWSSDEPKQVIPKKL
jgi:hypothetical protein